jgi:hypothetical protein
MNHSCAYGSGCLLTSIGMFVVWWLAAAILLWQTWNKVIGAVTKVKPVKPWQTLLLVATIAVFCAPRWMAHQGFGSHADCCQNSKHCEFEGRGGEGKGDCPYSHPQADSAEPKKAE